MQPLNANMFTLNTDEQELFWQVLGREPEEITVELVRQFIVKAPRSEAVAREDVEVSREVLALSRRADEFIRGIENKGGRGTFGRTGLGSPISIPDGNLTRLQDIVDWFNSLPDNHPDVYFIGGKRYLCISSTQGIGDLRFLVSIDEKTGWFQLLNMDPDVKSAFEKHLSKLRKSTHHRKVVSVNKYKAHVK